MAAVVAALTSAAARYNELLKARPLTTNAVTGAVVASLGDIACQKLILGAPEWDARRTADMGVIRAVVMAPFLQLYFPFLARLVPGTTTPRALLRVLADQAIGSPVSISLTFAAASLLRGEPAAIVPRIRQELAPTWVNGAQFWPFVHFITFRFVPPAFQPLWTHCMSVYWNAVLSLRSWTPLAQPGDEGAQAAGFTKDSIELIGPVAVVAAVARRATAAVVDAAPQQPRTAAVGIPAAGPLLDGASPPSAQRAAGDAATSPQHR
jgi:protein Mpv17